MGTSYDTDVIAWAKEQAALLRGGHLADIDVFHIADEIEDVGRSEQRELVKRASLLLTELLKWRFQPGFRCEHWRRGIELQRKAIAYQLRETPSLKDVLSDAGWRDEMWMDATVAAVAETGMDAPDTWIWSADDMLRPGFFPD
jgi:hypothetical protein